MTEPFIEKHSEILVEALCAHELFKQFGYSTEEVFLVVNPASSFTEKMFAILVQLRHRGKKVHIRMGEATHTFEEISARWDAAVQSWNALDRETAQRIYSNSKVRKDAVKIMMQMLIVGLGVTSEQIEEHDLRHAGDA